MVQVHKIYGSLAALPIVLTWIYISWVIALVGCRLCFALDASRKAEPEQELQSAAARETFVARTMLELARLHRERGGPVGIKQLARVIQTTPRIVRECLRALATAGLAAETRRGTFLPSRDPSQITLAQTRTAARVTLRHPPHHLDPVGAALAQAWERADGKAAADLDETVAQLLARVDRAEAAERSPKAQEAEIRPQAPGLRPQPSKN
jgi:membrane protein